MPTYRVQVAYERAAFPEPGDRIINTFHLGTPNPIAELDTLAGDAATLFATYREHPVGITTAEARIYDLADAEPREPLAIERVAVTQGALNHGPREVALCLSYYGGRNLPRRRGRIYVGPWGTAFMTERPPSTAIDQLVTLAQGIANLGGADIDWVTRSTVSGETHAVTDFWIDDEWDTQRSRGLKAGGRRRGSTTEDTAG